MATTNYTTCPHRCFLVHVPERMRQHSSLRLLGLAVGYTNNEGEYTEMTLDDGTALAHVQVPQFMIRSCQASPHETFLGQLLDCIVRVDDAGRVLLRAEQISILQDDPHAELVRWFELSYSPQSNVSMERGFPVPELTPDDFLDMIQLDCTTTTTTSDDKPLGVSMEDLALFFQVDQGTVEEFLEELQMSGQIYQNNQGNYLPL